MINPVAGVCAALFFLVAIGPASLAQDREWGVNRSITQVSPSVYRWGSDNQYGAYIVGSDAIAVVDDVWPVRSDGDKAHLRYSSLNNG